MLPSTSSTEPQRPQETRQPTVGLAVGGTAHVPLAEGARAFLGRLEVPEVASAAVEPGAEGLTTWHRCRRYPPATWSSTNFAFVSRCSIKRVQRARMARTGTTTSFLRFVRFWQVGRVGGDPGASIAPSALSRGTRGDLLSTG